MSKGMPIENRKPKKKKKWKGSKGEWKCYESMRDNSLARGVAALEIVGSCIVES